MLYQLSVNKMQFQYEETKLQISKGQHKTRVVKNMKDIVDKMGDIKDRPKKVKQIIESYLKHKIATSVSVQENMCIIKGVDKIDTIIQEKMNQLLETYFYCECCGVFDIQYAETKKICNNCDTESHIKYTDILFKLLTTL